MLPNMAPFDSCFRPSFASGVKGGPFRVFWELHCRVVYFLFDDLLKTFLACLMIPLILFATFVRGSFVYLFLLIANVFA